MSVARANLAISNSDNQKVQKKGKKKEDISGKIKLIEAALYVAGRPLDLKTLCNIAGSRSEKKIQKIVRMLMDEYKRRNTALEILELDDHRFVLQLKNEFSEKVRKLAIRPLLTVGPLRTLSYIAYKQPVTQKQVIEARGKNAYRHIKELLEMGLITREKGEGKNSILRTTDFFADYFGLSRNIQVMKRQLKRIFEMRGEETLPASLKKEEQEDIAKIKE
jgi:segregation and condensation protein B